MNNMLKIYETVRSVMVRHYRKESIEFKRGASVAMKLFETGIKKSETFNQAIKIKELEKEIQLLKIAVREKTYLIEELREKLINTSLISGVPAKKFQEYIIPITDLGTFNIVTNIDSPTLTFCIYEFVQKHQFKRIDEAKSKLLVFINNKNHLGFYAYKDLKSYKKQHNEK